MNAASSTERTPANYPFPGTPLEPGSVRWDGHEFVIAEKHRRKILCYDDTQSNWSDELTQLHEQETGSNHPIDKASRRLAIRSVRKYLRAQNPVLLDVGCSSGFLLEELRSAFPSAQILGADYIPELLERVAMRLSGVPIVQFDLRKCPLPDNSIDAITCLNVLEHIDNDRQAAQHLARILRPGGIAHIEVPAGPHLYDIYDEHLMHHRRYRLEDLKMLIADAGLEILEATHLGVFIYPAFSFVKRRQRSQLALPAEEKKKIIAGQIRATGRSSALDALLNVETALGQLIPYPMGIRCIVVARNR